MEPLLSSPRVIVANFHQETNSFTPKIWTREQFENDTFQHGEEVIAGYNTTADNTLFGMVSVAKEYHAQIFPSSAVRSTSGGAVDHGVVEEFITELLDCYERNKPIHAFLLALHGATQSTKIDDVCGYILAQVRRAVGEKVLIGVACDLHANITAQCMENADYICGFQAYPHVDQFRTGVRLAGLIFDRLEKDTRDYSAYATVPMIVPASGYTTNEGSMRRLMDRAQDMVHTGKLKDFTVFMMQPWLDAREAASTVITVGDDAQTAQECAESLAKELYSFRDELWPELYSMDDVIQRAKNAPKGRPVVLVDFADSPGGGSLGDSSAVVDVLQQQGFPVSAITVITDPETVYQAEKLGVGGEGNFLLGGKLTKSILKPTAVYARVRSLHDGVFRQKGPVGTGQRRNLGRTAVLSVNNMDVVVCEHACGCGDPEIYRAFGVEPTAYQLVVVKANTSFRAAYQDMVSDIMMADTPGSCTAALHRLPYTHLPRPFYPLTEMPDELKSDTAIYYRRNKC